MGWFRVSMLALAVYGGICSLAVYSPRFLRKWDVSFLPRNNPHYIQTGWNEWMVRIRSKLNTHSSTREIWADSALSRDQLQYGLGRTYRVRSLEELPRNNGTPDLQGNVPPSGVFYVREVYLAQINPSVIFQGRRDAWTFPSIGRRWQELDSTEIFSKGASKKGDPLRQFQLYFIPGRE